MKFDRSDFYWNELSFASASRDLSCEAVKARMGEGVRKIAKAVEILNTLTPEQQEAVRLYGQSRFWEGEDQGSQNPYC